MSPVECAFEMAFELFWKLFVPVAAVSLAIWSYARYTLGICKVTRDLTGKIALVTGSNTGIGRETAIELAKLGCKVYIACRGKVPNEPDPRDTVEHIKTLSDNSQIRFVELDTSRLNSIRKLAKTFPEKKLDILINNAGITAPSKTDKRILTEDGLELVMATNYFGHFLLTNLLLEKIKLAKGRIIMLSSISNLYGELPSLNKDSFDLNYDQHWPTLGPYSFSRVYGRSKLCMAMFARELADRCGSEVSVASVHPGTVRTGITSGLPTSVRKLTNLFVFTLSGRSSWEGAQTTLYLALCDKFESGRHYADCGISRLVSPAVKNAELRQKVWSETCRLVHLGNQL